MQAQFHPPEPSLSADSVGRSNSTYPGPAAGANSWSVPSATEMVVRQAARAGEFRAIAALLNQALYRYEITTWVGEASPGCLQITVTVKHPPQRQPLIRFIAHHLYLLQSDVILGANITVQLAETNLILWHQLVRLPLPTIYKKPPRWQLWRNKVQQLTQTAWQQGQTHLTMLQRSAHTVWQQGRQHIRKRYEMVRSHPSVDPLSPQPSSPPTASISDGAGRQTPHRWTEAPVPRVVNALRQITQPQSDNSPKIPQSTLAENSPVPKPSVTPTLPPLDDSLQWTELAMLPVNWTPTPTDRTPSSFSTQTDVAETFAETSTPTVPQLTQHEADVVPMAATTARPKTPSSNWLTTLEQIQKTVGDRCIPPNYWILSGLAIAILAMGGGFEAVQQYFSPPSDRTLLPPKGDIPLQSSPPLTPDASSPEDMAIPPKAVPSPTSGIQNGVPSSSSQLDANSDQPSRSTKRPKMVQTAVGEVNVIPIAPVVPTPETVTLTFSNDAIVPLPPSGQPAQPKWRWPLTSSPVPPVSHPADLAIALLNQVPLAEQDSFKDSSITATALSHTPSIPLLQQGGIDLVNLASNEVATAKGFALADILSGLDQNSILHVGVGLNKTEARQPQIFDIKGHRIAVLGYTDTHLYAASDAGAGTNPLSLGRLTADIEAIRDQVDWVIVTYHWHGDLTTIPTEQQIALAHFAVDQGADVVVGTHPQVMQGGEIYQGRAIAYSLGPVHASPATAQMNQDGALLPDKRSAMENGQPVAPMGHSTQPDTDLEQGSPNTQKLATHKNTIPHSTVLLQVVVSDRIMEVSFIPVNTKGTSATFLDGEEAQIVLQAIKTASQGLTMPLSVTTTTRLLINQGMPSFSHSDSESFSPARTDSFIGPSPD